MFVCILTCLVRAMLLLLLFSRISSDCGKLKARVELQTLVGFQKKNWQSFTLIMYCVDSGVAGMLVCRQSTVSMCRLATFSIYSTRRRACSFDARFDASGKCCSTQFLPCAVYEFGCWKCNIMLFALRGRIYSGTYFTEIFVEHKKKLEWDAGGVFSRQTNK